MRGDSWDDSHVARMKPTKQRGMDMMKITGTVLVNKRKLNAFGKNRECQCTLCRHGQCGHEPLFVAKNRIGAWLVCGTCAEQYQQQGYEIWEMIF